MPSCLDQSFIKTAAVEKVVAPISSHLCLLVLLCDSEHEPEQFTRLEAAAHAVARATENMAAVASRQIEETDDDVLHMEMSALLESVTVSGQHVLLAAQKLHIQPCLTEHREELITATQNVFLGVVKVLLVEDDAAVRRIIAVADQVLDHLSELGSSPDIKSLFESFQAFSEALILLNRLTLDRANSLQDTRQTNQLLDSLDILRRCISMLHTALCTTIKHPTSEEAKASKRYILDKVNSTISEIVVTLRSDKNKGHVGPCGFFTDRRNSLLQLLTNPSSSSIHDSGLDSMVRDVVFHCMAVANASQRESQHRLVSHCRHILQFWSDIKWISTSSEVSEEGFDQLCALMVQQIQMLNSTLMTEVLYQVLDTFLLASSVADELSDATSQVLASDSGTSVDLTCIQPVVEDFITVTDRIIQLVNFISAIAVDVKSLENMENSRMCFTRLRALMASLSLELDDDSMQTVQKLYDAYKKWEEETSELQDALSDVVDVKEFTSLAINEMINDRHGCDTAYREQSYKLFDKYAKHLVSHMKLVIPSVKRHLDRSDNPIYRNGLLVLLKQVRDSQTRVMESIKDMLLGSTINVERYSAFTNNVSTVIRQFKVLREGLDGNQHPHLLSPLREAAREPDICQSSLPVQDTCKVNLGLKSLPVVEVKGKDSHTKNVEPIEAEVAHKHDSNDLKMAAVPDEHKLIHKPPGFDLLPLLFEVVTVTKGKDVSVLNQTCTRVLELSNCYAQAAKEASAIVDLVDCQTLESFRAELVSLTPLLVQTAQETAMSSAKSTEGIYKHCTQFSDLLNNIRKVLIPVGGAWYHAVYAELRRASAETSVRQRLNEVMALCTEVVQVLSSSDINLQTDSQETFSVLQSKLSKAQTNTRHLIESSTTPEIQEDQLGGFCILWAISVQNVVNSLDKILWTSTAVTQTSPQKQLSALSENSLRIQEAARLTSLNCKSPYKSKQLTKYQNELRALTEDYLKAAEELDMMPSVTQLAKSVFFHRHLLVKIRALSVQLSKENREFETAFQNTVSIAYVAAKSLRQTDADDTQRRFESAAQALAGNVKSGTRKLEDCLNYIRDPRTRSNLRSISDHLSFQISDIIGRAKLMVETRYICDTLTLDVQIRCWSSKAHYVVEEIRKQDGIHQEAKEYIQAGLQGRTPVDVSGPLAVAPNTIQSNTIKELDVQDITQKHNQETTDTAEVNERYKKDGANSAAFQEAPSLTHTSFFLKQKSTSWDPKDNRIVQVTRKMADTICYMTQYLKKRGPILNKETFVAAAKDVILNSQSVTQFIRVIANHSLDKQCTVELSLIIEQILTITNQLSIISSVNAVTPGCRSSDEILVKNAQNLLQTILRGVHAAETASITGLKQPEPNSDEAEATALCFQWKRNLEIHRAQQTSNQETDDLGLRKTLPRPTAPSLAPLLNI